MFSVLAVLCSGILALEPANHAVSRDYAITCCSATSRDEIIGLQGALLRYQSILRTGGWPEVPAGEPLGLGSIDPRVRIVRQRLVRTGELPHSAVIARSPEMFDGQVVLGVRRFQERHGLSVTGVLDSKTAEAMSVPVEERIRQLRANLWRLRWVPAENHGRLVRVNVPAYEVTLYEHGEVVARMRAVVGRVDRPTPVLFSEINILEVNPSWWVPPRIARERILPNAARDPDWLRQRGYELRDGGTPVDPGKVDWSQVEEKGRLPYTIRQRPGSGNAMGRVKFIFPNDRMIYLHDTPARGVFERLRRDLSHGCVRVQRPVVLARFLLQHKEEENAEAVLAAIRGEGFRATRRIELPAPVTIQIVYLTAWVDERGVLQFRTDVYGKD